MVTKSSYELLNDLAFYFKKLDASANIVTVAPAGSETVEGAANVQLTTQYAAVILLTDGNDWWIASTSVSGGGSSVNIQEVTGSSATITSGIMFVDLMDLVRVIA